MEWDEVVKRALEQSNDAPSNNREWDETVKSALASAYTSGSERTRGFEVIADEHRKFPDKEIILPVRGSKRSAGYDFFSPVYFALLPGQSTKFATDVKAYMLEDEVLKVYPRSSIGIKQVMITNTVGIVDSDYYSNEKNDGNITIFLRNLHPTDTLVVEEGDRVAQGIFTKYLLADGDDYESGQDRKGGYGHTGR